MCKCNAASDTKITDVTIHSDFPFCRAYRMIHFAQNTDKTTFVYANICLY